MGGATKVVVGGRRDNGDTQHNGASQVGLFPADLVPAPLGGHEAALPQAADDEPPRGRVHRCRAA